MKKIYRKKYKICYLHFFLLCFIVVVCFAGCTSSGEKLNQEGISFANEKDYTKALEKFLLALKQDPDRFENHLNVAQIYMIQGDTEKATVHIDKALALESNIVEIYLMKAQVLFAQGKEKEADELLSSLVVKNKNNSRLHQIFISLGDDAFQRKEWERSLSFYRKALKVKENDANTYSAIGRTLVFKEMVSQFGNHNYGDFITTLNIRKSNLDEAKSAFRKAIYINNDYPYPHLMLGMMAMQNEDYKEAQVEIGEVLRIDPDHLAALITMSFNEHHLGDNEKSQQYLKIAKKKYPKASESFFLEAFLLIEQKKYTMAISHYVSMWKNFPALRKNIIQNFRVNISHYSSWLIPLVQHEDTQVANFCLDILKEITQKDFGTNTEDWEREILFITRTKK